MHEKLTQTNFKLIQTKFEISLSKFFLMRRL